MFNFKPKQTMKKLFMIFSILLILSSCQQEELPVGRDPAEASKRNNFESDVDLLKLCKTMAIILAMWRISGNLMP